MDSNILDDVKKVIGADVDEAFDIDLLMHINTALGIMTQVGVGSPDGMLVTASSKWSDFITNRVLIPEVKSFVYLKVRLMFDPPSSAAAIENAQKLCDELAWRIRVKACEG